MMMGEGEVEALLHLHDQFGRRCLAHGALPVHPTVEVVDAIQEEQVADTGLQWSTAGAS